MKSIDKLECANAEEAHDQQKAQANIESEHIRLSVTIEAISRFIPSHGENRQVSDACGLKQSREFALHFRE